MTVKRVDIDQYTIQKFNKGESQTFEDHIAIEAPLEIRLKKQNDVMSKSVAVTMRTPGNDKHLALGFLFTEGILKSALEVISTLQKEENVIEIEVKNGVNLDLSNADRNFYTTSSCGVCGKASIEAIKVNPSFTCEKDFSITSSILNRLQSQISSEQKAFSLTGGIHASAIFDSQGTFKFLTEDVGRHNALDKLIGHFFEEDTLPLSQSVLLLSGRASFELIQKAAMAGISVIAAVGAPSSLAIDMAKEHSLTLVGFLKPDRFNIYSGHERIKN